MKQCTGLWIVAPINRAVDDKAAKTLLGESFRRQLKYDGGFSSVTFICSKTDDISVTEAIDSLQLENEITELEEQRDEHRRAIKDFETQLADLKESQQVYKSAQTGISDDIETWEDLQEKLDDGDEVFAPFTDNKKRKMNGKAKSRKRRRGSDDDSDDDSLASDAENSASEDEVTIKPPRTPLTEPEIKEKLKELRESKKNARREGLKIRDSVNEMKPKIEEHHARIREVKAKITRVCISGRNQYSKTAIQQDFAAGIKEIDQENAVEEDEDNFNLDEELRDYDEVAKSLPVFCVSSRAYQKMCGRLAKDDPVPGFVTPEETEIPQLQAHCKKLTEAGRI